MIRTNNSFIKHRKSLNNKEFLRKNVHYNFSVVSVSFGVLLDE